MVMGIAGKGHRRWSVAVLSIAVLTVTACSGSTGASGAPAASVTTGGGGGTGSAVAAGDDLCKLLGPGDFASVGVTDARGPTENNSPPSGYFCVYRGKSSATGGIEFDAFVSDTAADAHDAFPDLFSEFVTTDDVAVTIAGADEATLSVPTFDGSTDPVLIGVRKGNLTIGIGMGTAFADVQKASDQVKRLAALVIQRAAALGG